MPLPELTALSECLPVLLTRAVAEAAFCSLGDWLNVCRTPRGVVAEPRDSWLEACSGKREMAHVRKEKAEREVLSAAFPCCGRPLPTHTGSLKSKIRRPGHVTPRGQGKERGREKQRDRRRQLMWSRSGREGRLVARCRGSQHCSSDL